MTAAANLRRPFASPWTSAAASRSTAKLSTRWLGGIAAGALAAGDQLPTVRQLAVDLAINPNTVIRAYRELEMRDVLETQQGTGTFISRQKARAMVPSAAATDPARRRIRGARRLGRFSLEELIRQLQDLQKESGKKKGDKRGGNVSWQDRKNNQICSLAVALFAMAVAIGLGLTALAA